MWPFSELVPDLLAGALFCLLMSSCLRGHALHSFEDIISREEFGDNLGIHHDLRKDEGIVDTANYTAIFDNLYMIYCEEGPSFRQLVDTKIFPIFKDASRKRKEGLTFWDWSCGVCEASFDAAMSLVRKAEDACPQDDNLTMFPTEIFGSSFPLDISKNLNWTEKASSITKDNLNPIEIFFSDLAVLFCRLGKFASKYTCPGIVKIYSPVIMAVLKRTNIDATEACAAIGLCDVKLGGAHDSGTYSKESMDLELRSSTHSDVPEKPEQDEEYLYFSHFSDLHLDLEYMPTSEASCPDPICCRADSHHGDEALIREAGPFGDYRCDLPLNSAQLAFESINDFSMQGSGLSMHLFSGDILPHDIWQAASRGQINQYFSNFENLVDDHFDPKVPLFGAIGNHEGTPPNLFVPKSMPCIYNETAWLYSRYAAMFRPWISNDESYSSFAANGYYSIKNIPSFPGLKLIVLNNNLAYAFNFWLYVDYFDEDPDGMLAWLDAELKDAQLEGQVVYILGHEPPGQYDCLKRWNRRFDDLVVKYACLIKGMFYGHTHYDHFKLFYGSKEGTDEESAKLDKVPVNIAWITPALTTYVDMLPGYRIYGVSKKDYTIKKIYTYTMSSLGDANDTPTFQLSYEMKAEYGLPDFSPRSMHRLTQAMASNSTLFNSFHKHYYKNTKGMIPHCSNRCRKRMICQLQHSLYNYSC